MLDTGYGFHIVDQFEQWWNAENQSGGLRRYAPTRCCNKPVSDEELEEALRRLDFELRNLWEMAELPV